MVRHSNYGATFPEVVAHHQTTSDRHNGFLVVWLRGDLNLSPQPIDFIGLGFFNKMKAPQLIEFKGLFLSKWLRGPATTEN